MIWTILTTIATLISMVAFIVTALYIRAELKGLEKDRYLTVTNEIFMLWQSKEFMEAQLWLLHKMQTRSWQEFIQAHRADVGELAFHRVGSFYDRVGTLVRMGLIDEKEILATIGGYAIGVWQQIEPLVREARQIENSVLFQDYERLLPACHECYVPSLDKEARIHLFSQTQTAPKISPAALKQRLDRGEPLTLLDVRRLEQPAPEVSIIPNSIVIPPDEIAQRYQELPREQEIVVYCT